MKNIKANAFLKDILGKYSVDILLIPIFCCIYLHENVNIRTYIFFNDILFISVIVTYIFAIIQVSRINNIKNEVFKYILLNSSILLIIKAVSAFFYILDVIFEYNIIIYAIQNTLEFLQMGIIFKINTVVKKIKYLIFFYYLQILSIVYVIGKNFYTLRKRDIWKVYFTINFIMSIIVIFIVVKGIIKMKDILIKNIAGYIILYSTTIICNYIYYLAFTYNVQSIVFISLILEVMGFCLFYNKIVIIVSKEYIQAINVRTKEINEIIKRRNMLLKEINAVIQKGKDKYNDLIDCIYDGVFLFHLDKLQYMNKNALKLLQIDNKNDITGMDINKFIGQYSNRETEKESYECIVSKIKVKDENNEMFLIDIDEYNKILYVHDISELNENKKLKEELNEYLKFDEIKKKFFANISHEFKTPINVIFSALQVNDIHIKDNNLKGIAKNSKIIRQNCLRLIRTINNFIDANKISEGYINPSLKVHNIVEILEDTANLCNKYISQVDNTLIFDSEEEEIYVLCDKEMIMTIILNILSNSVKYSIKGGWIKINIEIVAEDSINIRIKNNGLKIEQNTVPYIFDKFTKLNKAFNRLREGSGLGLFLTKGLVELQNGKIKLISSEEGNEFIIEFPKLKDDEYPLDGILEEELKLNELEEKVDIEFSDIYLE